MWESTIVDDEVKSRTTVDLGIVASATRMNKGLSGSFPGAGMWCVMAWSTQGVCIVK